MENFLRDFHWKSRSEGSRDSKTEQGRIVSSFIIDDLMSHKKAKGYYIIPKRSAKNSSRLICHLEYCGDIKNMMRIVLPATGLRMLGEWAVANFPGVHTLLFD